MSSSDERPDGLGADLLMNKSQASTTLQERVYTLAPVWRRLLAYGIDIILLATIDFVLVLLHLRLFVLLYVCYFLWFFSTSGQTLGAVLLSIRVVQEDGGALTLRTGAVRVAMFLFSTMIFGLGILWMLWDRQRQTWHDKMAGTLVIMTQ